MLSWRWRAEILALPQHCEPQNNLLLNLSSSFDTCIPTNLALFSTLLGSLSICAWLFAQLPQIYKNWKLRSTAGLSIYFLVEWCLGDTANLVGAVLTKQATWQVMVAAYYTFVDCVLVFQFIYFTYFISKKEIIDGLSDSPPPASTPKDRHKNITRSQTGPDSTKANPTPPRAVNKSQEPMFDTFRFPPLSASSSPREKSSHLSTSRPTVRHTSSASYSPSPKAVLTISLLLAIVSHTQASPLTHIASIPSPHRSWSFMSSTPSASLGQTIGQVSSWLSTALYLGSRLPQLYKNFTRKSTAGLSPTLFVAAFFGNLFYSTSLLSNPLAWGSYGPHGLYGWAPAEGSEQTEWVLLATPFFLGAAGVLGLDGAMGVQFLVYGDGVGSGGADGKVGRGRGKAVIVRDEDGKGHWRKVSGWMRGWVPSPRLGPTKLGPGGLSGLEGVESLEDEGRALLGDEADREDSGIRSGRLYGTTGGEQR